MTMVTFRIYQFECDAPGCDAISDEYGPGVAADARAQAEREGWTRDGRDDYCPRHAAPLGATRVSLACPDCGRMISAPKGATGASHGGQCVPNTRSRVQITNCDGRQHTDGRLQPIGACDGQTCRLP